MSGLKAGFVAVGVAAGIAVAFGSQSTQAATLEVENLDGSGPESLAARVAEASAGDIIAFDASLAGTITLDATLLIDKNLTITGTGTRDIVITKATGDLVSVAAGATLTLSNIELEGSDAHAISLATGAGGLAIDDVEFDGNDGAVDFDAATGAISMTDAVVGGGVSGVTGDGADGVTVTTSTFSGLSGAAIDVTDGGAIVISGTIVDSDGATDPLGLGVRLEAPVSVAVSATSVSGQADIGLDIVGDFPDVAAENVTITGGSFSNNTGGVRSTGTGTFDMTGTTVSTNTEPDPSTFTGFGIGARVIGHSVVTLTSVTGAGNEQSAVRVGGATSLTATSLALSGNSGGLGIETVSGDATVDGGTFNGNDFTGVNFSRVSGVLTFDGVTATGNGDRGITGFGTSATNVAGQTKVRIVDASNLSSNGDIGAFLQNAGEIVIADSSFDENVGGGLVTTHAVSVDIDGSDFDDNTADTAYDGHGAGFEYTEGAITIDDSDFTGNASEGIEVNRISSTPDTTSIDVTGGSIASNGIGIDIRFTAGPTTIESVAFDSNGVGVDIDDADEVTIVDSTFAEHTSYAVDSEDSALLRLDGVTVDEGASLVDLGSGVRSVGDAAVEVVDTSITNQAATALQVNGGFSPTDPELVTITGSTFSDNTGAGVSIIQSNGPIEIGGTSVASSNTGHGVALSTTGPVAFGGLTASSNGVNGIDLSNTGAVTGTSVTASFNSGAGIRTTSIASFSVANTPTDSVDGNTGKGAEFAATAGPVTFGGGSVSNNGDDGIRVFTTTDAQTADHGTVTITGPTTLNDNDGNGIEANFDRPSPLPASPTGPTLNIDEALITGSVNGLFAVGTGAITITDSSFDSNDFDGATSFAAAGDVSAFGSTFDGNGASGLDVTTNGSANTTMKLLVDNTTANGNTDRGIHATVLGEVAVVNGSTASLNGTDGLHVSSSPVQVRLTDSAFDDNGGEGAHLGSTSTPLTGATISGSTFDDNTTGNGIQIVQHSGTATIAGGSASGNGEHGVLAGQSASATGSLVVSGTAVDDNPTGIKTFGASAATISSVAINGHTGRAIELIQGGTDVTISATTVGAAGQGVLLQTVGDVDIDGLIVAAQTSGGLDVDGASGSVDVAGSNISNNEVFGIDIDSTGSLVSVGSTTANGNDRVGLRILAAGDVVLNGVTSNANTAVTAPSPEDADGISLAVSGDVSMTNVVANDNEGIGIRLSSLNSDDIDSITVSGGTANDNDNLGLVATSADGPTEVSGFDSNGNGATGISLGGVGDVTMGTGNNVVGSGDHGVTLNGVGAVDITGLIVADSDGTGLRIIDAGGVAIGGSTIDRNGDAPGEYGAHLATIAGGVTVTGSNFRSNHSDGLKLDDATGVVRIDGSTFSLNPGFGASIGTSGTTIGAVSSTGSTFADNGTSGLLIVEAGDVALTDFTGTGNYPTAPNQSGAALDVSNVGDVVIVNPDVSLNGGIVQPAGFPGGPAILITDAGDVEVVGGSMSDNHTGALQASDVGDVSVDGTTFDSNDEEAVSAFGVGAVAIADATVSGHPGDGVSIGDPTGAVSVSGATFANNGSTGLDINGADVGLSIDDSEFSDNQSGLRLNDSAGVTTVSDSTFASSAFALRGDAVGGLAVADSTFTNSGTAISWTDVSGDVDVSGSTFTDNGGRSLAVEAVTGSVSIEESTVTGGNQPSLFDTVGGSVTIDRSSFVENGSLAAPLVGPAAFDSADPFGGLLVVIDAAGGLDISTSTISDNEVSTPLIGAEATDVTIRHSTIADNRPATQVGSDGAVVVDHSIVMGRDASSSFDAADVTATFSVVAEGTSLGGSTIELADPELAPLATVGSTTPTRAPLAESSVVDAGDPNISGAPATDQRNGTRVLNVIDIGAIELDPDRDDPPPPAAALIESLSPARFADTRPTGVTVDGDFQADGRLEAQGEYRVQIAGRGLVPADAEGVVMNITAVGVDGNGFVTAHPCVTPRPLASSLNYAAGVNLGNEIVAGLSDSGEICLFSSRGTHLTVDVTGYVPAGSEVVSITPTRFMDTRPGESTFDNIGDDDGKLEAGSDTILLIQSRGEIPSGLNGEDGIAAVIVNVTAIGAEGTGFVTVHPCLDPPPLASSLNYVAGVNRGNELVAPVDAGGRICLFTSATTHLTVDVVGYIPRDTDLSPVDPSRLLDTRPGQVTVDGAGAGAGKLTGGDSITVQVGGRGEVPDGATAAIVNVTAIAPESVGFVTVHPCLDPAPNASSLNYVPGVNGGNEIIALLDDDGQICLFTSSTAHLAVDVVGYIS